MRFIKVALTVLCTVLFLSISFSSHAGLFGTDLKEIKIEQSLPPSTVILKVPENWIEITDESIKKNPLVSFKTSVKGTPGPSKFRSPENEKDYVQWNQIAFEQYQDMWGDTKQSIKDKIVSNAVKSGANVKDLEVNGEDKKHVSLSFIQEVPKDNTIEYVRHYFNFITYNNIKLCIIDTFIGPNIKEVRETADEFERIVK